VRTFDISAIGFDELVRMNPIMLALAWFLPAKEWSHPDVDHLGVIAEVNAVWLKEPESMRGRN
jgi:hypothetical protein